MPAQQNTTQAEVIGFLLSPDAYPVPGPVSHIETHGAHVFLCGDVAVKIKRAVRYDYMDLSTAALRHALLTRELALNRVTAPMIYRDVVPITRRADGGLQINGDGPPVEWMLRMHRFAATCELTNIAASGGLTDQVADLLGRVIQHFHAACPEMAEAGDDLIREILDELGRVLAEFTDLLGDGGAQTFLDRARRQLAAVAPVLRDRSARGHVRRGHGDLHLRNLLLIDGQPVLFDALEFDERLATCDVLYDLAFVLMDLCHRGLCRPANVTMNAYLLAAGGVEDSGLAALPLFLSVRAAIRAMVLLQTGQATGQASGTADEARQYLTQALGDLAPPPPRLIAVGGLSGTGKTVLALDLAPDLGPCPGAVHLRTDTERKAQPHAVAYDPASRARVYEQMFDRAAALLAAGCCVVLDATFLDPAQCHAARALARRLNVPFTGLWLTAPQAVLLDRVSARRGDASDADVSVLRAQIASLATPDWTRIDASGTPEATRAAADAALGGITETINPVQPPQG